MKLFEMEGFLRGKCIPRDLKVNETNAEYLVRKFAEADAMCAALASENAGLKNALEWLYETVSSESVSIPDEKYSSVTNAAQVLSETPATDAFLSEVRASGIDQWIASREGRWNGTTAEAERFAAQLRQEAAQ
ncbi:hypothetical protein [Enterobacter hormaechei]|uniref:hypothetical protein n=1 Tax=Enterobacter hormaechei TaxID=158836 RepID=UPI000B8CD3FD|nr:hypothetical protein [Enterobacter hormaechei]OXU37255.1 hypothetical protein BME81_05935 [Enterobacter hormaechei subsp. steigerwaltii]